MAKNKGQDCQLNVLLFVRRRLITANGGALAMCLCFHKNKNGKGILTNAMLSDSKKEHTKNIKYEN